ncbi:hypothetical protein C8N47_10145 [Mangrovibacterium marinum]|uniref:Uncharacterized protein n=1 Tax=Mangrovibacterium marinum TaxID=1639118 RepID=A0A2T5C639_9BACT|nr:hypothetical protein C8N47_10145 [Mangrovibacterium marinum]
MNGRLKIVDMRPCSQVIVYLFLTAIHRFLSEEGQQFYKFGQQTKKIKQQCNHTKLTTKSLGTMFN